MAEAVATGAALTAAAGATTTVGVMARHSVESE